MRKSVIVAALSAAMCVASVPSVQGAPGPTQTQEGMVVLPTPHPQAPTECFAGIDRRQAYVTQEMVNEVVGYHFDIDKATWGGKFKLEPTGGQGTIDLGIVFYASFDHDPTDVTGGPATYELDTREAGGEEGIVPAEMTKAIVCLWAGDQYQGAAATFLYEAFKPAKKKKKG